MKNVSETRCRQNQNTYFMSKKFSYWNRAVWRTMWKNTVEPNGPQMTIRRMRIVCRTPNATNTKSQYVILIAFPLQEQLHDRTSMLRNTDTAWHVITETGVLSVWYELTMKKQFTKHVTQHNTRGWHHTDRWNECSVCSRTKKRSITEVVEWRVNIRVARHTKSTCFNINLPSMPGSPTLTQSFEFSD
jgi:hypothetical protein